MKQLFFLLILFILPFANSNAQDYKPKGTYLNFNYTKSKLKFEDGYSLNNDWGAAITAGHTFFLHKKPIAGMVRFGLDWTFVDLNFSQYSEKYFDLYDDDDEEYYDDDYDKSKIYQGEIGMQFGPSVTVTPIKHLSLSAYFRYAPSFVGFYSDEIDEFKGSFGSFFVTGLSASYRRISLGIEQRWGSFKLKLDDDDDDYYYEEDDDYYRAGKVKTVGPRFYIGFRF